MTEQRPIISYVSGYPSSIFWAVVFACMFMTGNCRTCGGDVNYVSRFVENCQ